MTLHEIALDVLRSVAEVRLVAKLKDEEIKFPDADDIRFFIPDTHLVTPGTLEKNGYKYATNYADDLLPAVLQALARMKRERQETDTVVIYQLGDFLDLWRETPDPDKRVQAAERIIKAYKPSMQGFDAAKVRFLLGNHDLDLRKLVNFIAWERRLYLPNSDDRKATVMITHGDLFDWIEKYGPDEIQQVIVYYFAPLFGPNDYDLREVEKLVRKSHGSKNYKNKIQGTSDIGALGDPAMTDASFNVSTTGMFFESARTEGRKANAQYGLDLRMTVIGHTHHARIVADRDDQGLFVLMDCGAWIENCRLDDDTTQPSAQLGVLSENEIRIYQLSPKGDVA
jgi:UDP-2,3-diacylglucosamine pyrophosphatase LpxH